MAGRTVSRSFVTVSVSGHSRGSEARSLKTSPRAAQGSSPPAKSTTPPQRTAGLSRSDQGNKLGAPMFCQERSTSSSFGACNGIPKGVHSWERLSTGWRNA
jgi:hypothetical protein